MISIHYMVDGHRYVWVCGNPAPGQQPFRAAKMIEFLHAYPMPYFRPLYSLLPPTTFLVQVQDSGEWVTCVREDLLAEVGDDTRALPPASFATRAEADAFIVTLCGLMHCGGDPTLFRVVETARR